MNMPTPANFRYENTGHPVRDDLPEAYRWVWDKIAQPGNWWTGADRVSIAAESRNAIDCQLCSKRKDALSPFSVDGEHHTTTDLTAADLTGANLTSANLTGAEFEGATLRKAKTAGAIVTAAKNWS